MYARYRRSRKKSSVELTVITIFLLVSAALSVWLPYVFAQMVPL